MSPLPSPTNTSGLSGGAVQFDRGPFSRACASEFAYRAVNPAACTASCMHPCNARVLCLPSGATPRILAAFIQVRPGFRRSHRRSGCNGRACMMAPRPKCGPGLPRKRVQRQRCWQRPPCPPARRPRGRAEAQQRKHPLRTVEQRQSFFCFQGDGRLRPARRHGVGAI